MKKEGLQSIFNKYNEILKFEMRELGCKPTELRHLIGRLGEFYCAIHTNGELARVPNQHGFDVVSETGRKISVKTTAQKAGFISINKKTMDQFEDLMVLQLIDLELSILFHGPMNKIESSCRTWSGDTNKYELDISKIKNKYASKT